MPLNNFKTSEKGNALIRDYKTFASETYLYPAGKPTIGYGSSRAALDKLFSTGDYP